MLPGTHSKWARVESGRIAGFETFMTGEVFAVLKDHSVLGRMMRPPSPGAGFSRGVEAARGLQAPGDLLHAIFAARTFGLFETLPPDQLGEYLSGLLIASEIFAGASGAARATAIGAAALTARYVDAGAQLGVAIATAPDNCALMGLRALLYPLAAVHRQHRARHVPRARRQQEQHGLGDVLRRRDAAGGDGGGHRGAVEPAGWRNPPSRRRFRYGPARRR